ncbi:hypothetical protein [Sphingopyxis solisilvae]|uniref:hypothetical protein n=1 Tax=Sphingopyxis solisilvae TaxID=1886788 RepID=UPI001892B18E|nr:hypothetical protein [Sphingopyxis solisilvae]
MTTPPAPRAALHKENGTGFPVLADMKKGGPPFGEPPLDPVLQQQDVVVRL